MSDTGKPDIKLVRALQADFKELYQKEFTTSYKEQRLIRNIELGIMRLKNTEKLIAQQAKEAYKKGYIDRGIEELTK